MGGSVKKIALGTSFIVGLALSAGVAIAGPPGPPSPPPPPKPPILVFDDGGGGCYLTGSAWQVTPGDGVRFKNNDSQGHAVASNILLWQISIGPSGERAAKLHSAGTHRATCDDGTASYTVAKVKPDVSEAPAGLDFTVVWATPTADGSWRYEVQYRIGSGSWRTWFDRTSRRTARFNANDGTRYGFRVRTINPGEGETGWSPVKPVVA
jgi:hypothetical protein